MNAPQIKVEDPMLANPPDVEEYVDDKIFIVHFIKEKGFHIHLYKPVEKILRIEEQKIRDTGIAPWPEYKEPSQQKKQQEIIRRIDKCEARRQAWRETPIAAWPNITDLIVDTLVQNRLGNYEGVIDYIPEADSWSIKLVGAHRLSTEKRKQVVQNLVKNLEQILNWPPEEEAHG